MKYSKSIRTQLLLALTITFFVFLLVTMGGVYLFQKDALTRESIKKVTELDSVLKAGFKSQMLTHDTALTQTMVNEVGAFKNITDIFIINTDGVVKFSPDPKHIDTILHKDSIECRQCHHDPTGRNNLTLQTRNDHGVSILRNVTHIYNEAACYSCHPSSRKILGLLFVDYSMADTDALISVTLWRLFLTAVAAFIFLSFVILFITNRLIHRPIALLIDGTNDIKNGNYNKQISYVGNTEFTILADSFNDMSEKLRIGRDQLEERIQERTIELKTSNEQLAREIVEHRKAEEALRENEEKIHLLLNSTAEAIYGLDMNGNCTFCNSACLRLLGYKHPDELLGKNMHWQIHAKHPDGTHFPIEECRIFQAFNKGEGTHVDDEVLWRSDGSSFYAEYWSYPQHRDGVVVGAVMTFLDITARKQAEEALKEERRRLQQALDEVRTLRGIMPICAYCKKIRDDQGYWNQVEKYVSDHSDAKFSHGICPTCFEREMKGIETSSFVQESVNPTRKLR